jgi:hypothetical protein
VPATFLAIRKHLLAAGDQFGQNPAHPKFLYTLHPEECTPSFSQRFLQSDTCLVVDSYNIVSGKKCPKRFSESRFWATLAKLPSQTHLYGLPWQYSPLESAHNLTSWRGMTG